MAVSTARYTWCPHKISSQICFGNAKTCYVDGSSKATQYRFVQLFSGCMMVDQDGCIKQVPAAFALITCRKTEDLKRVSGNLISHDQNWRCAHRLSQLETTKKFWSLNQLSIPFDFQAEVINTYCQVVMVTRIRFLKILGLQVENR